MAGFTKITNPPDLIKKGVLYYFVDQIGINGSRFDTVNVEEMVYAYGSDRIVPLASAGAFAQILRIELNGGSPVELDMSGSISNAFWYLYLGRRGSQMDRNYIDATRQKLSPDEKRELYRMADMNRVKLGGALLEISMVIVHENSPRSLFYRWTLVLDRQTYDVLRVECEGLTSAMPLGLEPPGR